VVTVDDDRAVLARLPRSSEVPLSASLAVHSEAHAARRSGNDW
jgi:hypothetical protein